MDCPRCGVPTVVGEHDGVRVPGCERCGGMFLHRGELNKVAPTEGDLEFSTLHEESFRHPDAYGPIRCPDCGRADMRKVEFNVHTGIVLDWCPECGGFWIDASELRRIRDEVRQLDDLADSDDEPPMMWLVRFLWSLPR